MPTYPDPTDTVIRIRVDGSVPQRVFVVSANSVADAVGNRRRASQVSEARQSGILIDVTKPSDTVPSISRVSLGDWLSVHRRGNGGLAIGPPPNHHCE